MWGASVVRKYAFDKPEWVFRSPREVDSEAVLAIRLPGNRVAKALAPSELWAFAAQVLKTPVEELVFSLEPDDGGWVLVVAYQKHAMNLWRYTKSTLPYWARAL